MSKIFIGADHRGFKLKKKIIAFLRKQKYFVEDVGAFAEEPPCDYPKIAYDVATKVVVEPSARGILLCMTGIGHSIAANKVPGAYAALCYTKKAAEFSRRHNNANILVIGAKFVKAAEIPQIIQIWLSSPFDGGRHERRVSQIREIEREFLRT